VNPAVAPSGIALAPRFGETNMDRPLDAAFGRKQTRRRAALAGTALSHRDLAVKLNQQAKTRHDLEAQRKRAERSTRTQLSGLHALSSRTGSWGNTPCRA
jgi:hypothetical protein